MRIAVDSLLGDRSQGKRSESFASLSPQQMWALAFFTLGNPLRGFPFSRCPCPGRVGRLRPSSRRALLAGEPPSPRARAGDNPEGLGALAAVRDGCTAKLIPGPALEAPSPSPEAHTSAQGFGERTARGALGAGAGLQRGAGAGALGTDPAPSRGTCAVSPAAAPHGPRLSSPGCSAAPAGV